MATLGHVQNFLARPILPTAPSYAAMCHAIMGAALRHARARSAQIYFVDRSHSDVLLYSHLSGEKDPSHTRASVLEKIPIGVGAVGLVAAHGQIIFTTHRALVHASSRPADDFLEIKLQGGAVQESEHREVRIYVQLWSGLTSVSPLHPPPLQTT